MTGDVYSRNSGRPSHALTEQKRPLRIALAITAAIRAKGGDRKGRGQARRPGSERTEKTSPAATK